MNVKNRVFFSIFLEKNEKKIRFLAVKLLLLQFGMSDLDMEYIKIFVRPVRF